MDVSFEGRTALVTGAASGLGQAVARLLVDSGARVVGYDLAPITADGVEGHRVDIGDPASIDAAVAALDAPVDVLCNIAGLPQSKPAVDILRVNFLGLRHLTEALAPRMGSEGRVTNVSSNAGNGWPERRSELDEVLATPGFAEGLAIAEPRLPDCGDPYMYTKELVQLYTLRRSHTMYREHGVRMNSVSPGQMSTPMMDEFKKAIPEKMLDGVAKAAAMARVATPEEVAPSVVFLSSDLAGFCCGAIFDVDGGWTAAKLTDQVDYSLFG
jgi:NAD(P)-dependent dehydrogenase (short-subunit alcohol dehydrogenase family)